MGHKARQMRGFTLIASLLVLVLLSGVAIGLMFLVNSQQHVGSNDMEDNLAFYGAESGMEKMTSDLSTLYSAAQSPTAAQLANLANFPPTPAQVGAMAYVIAPPTQQVNAQGALISNFNTISTGPEQGLSALTIPINLQVQATRPSGASVNMLRTVEIALIPVFQFGVFCDSDCSYFAGPPFKFQGRIHTNGNLFLAANSGPLIADGKITVFGEIIRDRLANDHPATGGSYTGSVYAPNQSGGCNSYFGGGGPPPNCLDFGPDSSNPTNDASWSGGIPPAGGVNPNFATNSGIFNGFVTNHLTGAKQLVLPFVQGIGAGSASQQIQIIRKGVQTDSVSLTNSKLFNKAAIRIFLADTQALLHPDRPGLNDGGDIDLTGGAAQNGLAQLVNGVGTTRFAMAHTGSDPNGVGQQYWAAAPTGTAPYANGNWNLVNGWLRVEYLNAGGTYVPITTEWLGLGFARGLNAPTNPASGPLTGPGKNSVHPDAILVLQELDKASAPTIDGGGPTSQYSWYPINFWDPREGLPRDTNAGLTGTTTQCFANGIMNAVELDVGNLNLWLQGNIAGSGTNVNATVQNGYVLYFSDRRGMIADPNVAGPPTINGEYGFEDVVNSSTPTGMPDGNLEGTTPGYNVSNNITYSPEDSDQNGLLDTWGAANVGKGFLVNTAFNPYKVVDCLNGGRQNIVTGARHALKLVDGSLGNIPTAPGGSGGFTVAAENPVYVQGNYNSNAGDPAWNQPATDLPHAAAAIIADAVSFMSNNWTDLNSMANPTNLGARTPTATYYRTAVAAGKSLNFPNITSAPDFGTDGGVHNFLRLLENWGGVGLYYRGSLVSLFYSEYNTGTFKCCAEVYGAPSRNFSFDADFQNPNNLPPGTPMLQDINNLSERQDFTPQ